MWTQLSLCDYLLGPCSLKRSESLSPALWMTIIHLIQLWSPGCLCPHLSFLSHQVNRLKGISQHHHQHLFYQDPQNTQHADELFAHKSPFTSRIAPKLLYKHHTFLGPSWMPMMVEWLCPTSGWSNTISYHMTTSTCNVLLVGSLKTPPPPTTTLHSRVMLLLNHSIHRDDICALETQCFTTGSANYSHRLKPPTICFCK